MQTKFRSWQWWRWLMTGLNVLALLLSAIMSWHFLKGGPMAGCGGGSPCEQVLNSQWSMIAGLIPVSGLAVGIYIALLAAGSFIGQGTEVVIRHLAWSVMVILAGAIAGSAIWFTIVQKWIIGSFCPWCMTTHITGLLLAILIIWRAISEFKRPLYTVGRALTGLVLAGTLAACQIIFTPGGVYSGGGESNEKMPVLDYHSVPMTGSPDAPYIVTMLFDYQCSHCQKIHFMLNEAIHQYSGKLAFAMCPAPLNTRCNPYIPRDVDAFKNSCELAKVGLAVWVAGQNQFPGFEDWMFTFESGDSWHPRSLEAARLKAVELVGQEKFDAALSDPWISQYMETCIRIYGQTVLSGKGGIPKLIFGSKWVIPEPYNADDLVKILQKSLAMPRP